MVTQTLHNTFRYYMQKVNWAEASDISEVSAVSQ